MGTSANGAVYNVRSAWVATGALGIAVAQSREVIRDLIPRPVHVASTSPITSPTFGPHESAEWGYMTRVPQLYGDMLVDLLVFDERLYRSSERDVPLALHSVQRDSLYSSFWSNRLEELRRWRGDAHSGEAYSLSADALAYAAVLGVLTERILAAHDVDVHTMLVPLVDGGVQAEWTARRTRVEHFEVAINPHQIERFEVLDTTETVEGHLERVWRELDDASLSEVLAAFQEFVLRVPPQRSRDA